MKLNALLDKTDAAYVYCCSALECECDASGNPPGTRSKIEATVKLKEAVDNTDVHAVPCCSAPETAPVLSADWSMPALSRENEATTKTLKGLDTGTAKCVSYLPAPKRAGRAERRCSLRDWKYSESESIP